MSIEVIQLTAGQAKFLEAVNEGKNVFLTGKAGAGKSHVTREAMNLLKKQGKKVIAVAPTGIAAQNIEGQTIHSLFHVNPFGVSSFETCNWLSTKGKDALRKADTIVIDEVSMLRPDLLDAMHWTMKKNGLSGLLKKQIIFVGDMKQLPTIYSDNEKSVLLETYEGTTFQFAEIYKKLNVVEIDLSEVKRQSDPEFIEALNIIREGGKAPYFRQFFHQEAKGIILAPHNSTVRHYNEKGLAALEGELYTFKATISGNVKPEDFNLEGVVNVKIGAPVMYLRNSDNNPLRNGTIGTFEAKGDRYFIKVHGVRYPLEVIVSEKKQYVYNREKDLLELEVLGEIIQMPIRLAYALSIHKSQGLTFDEVTIDLRQTCFQPGQLYVALSRVRTPGGLRIITNQQFNEK